MSSYKAPQVDQTRTDLIGEIESKQVEIVTDRDVRIKLPFFKCNECSSTSLRRNVSATTYGHNDSNRTVNFYCMKCNHKSEYVYSEMHDTCVNFEEYKEILKDHI